VRGPILEIYLWPPGSALYSTTAGRHNLNSCTNLSNMVTPPPQKYLFLVHDSRGTLGPLISTSNPTRMCTIKEPSRLSNTLGNRGGHQAQADRHAAATAPCFSAIHAHHHVHHVHSRAPGWVAARSSCAAARAASGSHATRHTGVAQSSWATRPAEAWTTLPSSAWRTRRAWFM
jgi:hypothetical protein